MSQWAWQGRCSIIRIDWGVEGKYAQVWTEMLRAEWKQNGYNKTIMRKTYNEAILRKTVTMKPSWEKVTIKPSWEKSYKEAAMEKTCYNETITEKLLQWNCHEKNCYNEAIMRKTVTMTSSWENCFKETLLDLFMLIHINSSSIKTFYHSVLCSCENVDWLTKPYFIYKKILYMKNILKSGIGWMEMSWNRSFR